MASTLCKYDLRKGLFICSELGNGTSVTSATKSCRCSRAYGPDSLNIFHLKNLGPLATEHLTALYNYFLKSCRLSSIWKTSLVIPIPKPGKDSSLGTSYRSISLLCPAAKVLEALILPSSSSQQTSRQASTSGNHLAIQCEWP